MYVQLWFRQRDDPRLQIIALTFVDAVMRCTHLAGGTLRRYAVPMARGVEQSGSSSGSNTAESSSDVNEDLGHLLSVTPGT